MHSYHFDHALLPNGWARDVAVYAENGVIAKVEAGVSSGGKQRCGGIALPGLPNLHSHTFQRAMAGLTERRGPTQDSFWTWRKLMYRFLGELTPDDIEAIAAFAFAEMLEGGFTTVGEFHYPHHDTQGTPFGDIAETSGRIVEAAAISGIGLTLLPSFYAYGGIGGQPPVEGQRRFVNQPDRFLRLLDGARRAAEQLPGVVVGIAPHSLRAVTPETLAEVIASAPDGPIHIHAAEQVQEVEDCKAWSGLRPVEWLLENSELDDRWCLIHATHMTDMEADRLARSGATVGLCPLTEANLGDGIFNALPFTAGSGRFGVGSDSNIEITAPGEMKQLEYSQRLIQRARNVLAVDPGQSTGRQIYAAALEGGSQALQQPIGRIEAGSRADLVVLDGQHPDLAATMDDGWLDSYIFVAGRSAIRLVLAKGEIVVEEGRHRQAEPIRRRYSEVQCRVLGSAIEPSS